MTSRTLPLSDGSIARVIEAGAGEPVLLIHGVGMRAEAWGPQIQSLAAHHHVVAVDMPGHGESHPLPQGANLCDFVAWGARVIEALDLGAVNVAGHSMGALVAEGLAVERPDLVRRVALLNAVYRRSPEARLAVLHRADEIARGEGDAEAPLARWFSPAQADTRAQVAEWLHKVDRAGYAAAYRAFAEGDNVYADRLPSVRCPALVLTGDGDGNSTAAMTQAMAAAMPHGRSVVVADHRHMVNLTAPEVVSSALSEWLAEQEVDT